MGWRVLVVIWCVCVLNCLGKETNVEGNITLCPAQINLISPCQNLCEVDGNCTSGQICCFGSCQKNYGSDDKPEFYKMCTYPDPCKMGKCKHTVNCYSVASTGIYQCVCQPGWMGKNCDIDIDECKSDPCLHGGTCIDLVNDYTCCCPQDFTGKNCEQENLCLPCKHMQCPRFKDATCILQPRFVRTVNNKSIDVTDSCNIQVPKEQIISKKDKP